MKRRFSGTSKSRPFFDRKVGHYGYTRTLSLGKIIPKTWTYVRITKIKHKDNIITLTIEKLLERKNHAQSKTANKANKPNA